MLVIQRRTSPSAVTLAGETGSRSFGTGGVVGAERDRRLRPGSCRLWPPPPESGRSLIRHWPDIWGVAGMWIGRHVSLPAPATAPSAMKGPFVVEAR
jgi:hypothetical protein